MVSCLAVKPIPANLLASAALLTLSARGERTEVVKPEEFTIRIEPDGRVILQADGLQETSYRRILELLEETVGPVREIEAAPGDPPALLLRPATDHATSSEEEDQIHLDRHGGGG